MNEKKNVVVSSSSGPYPSACPACGLVLEIDVTFCPACGQKVNSSPPEPSPESPAAPSTPPPAPSTPAAVDVKSTAPPADSVAPAIGPRCCGQNLPVESKFCLSCGRPVGLATARFRLVGRGNPPVDVPLIGPELVIGKAADCQLPLPHDEYVSRHHAKFLVSGESVMLEDLGSSNGTYLRVQRAVEIKPGDEILVGTCILTLEEAP